LHRVFSFLLVAIFAVSGCARRPQAGDEPSSNPAAHDFSLASEVHVVSARIARGTTLASMLRAQKLAAADVTALIAEAAAVFDLRKVRADQPYRLQTSLEGSLKEFEYEIDGDRFLQVMRSTADALVATIVPIPKTRSVEVVQAQIDRQATSLVAALGAAGETIDLTLAIADIFGGEIDFSTEVQPGDRVELTVEKQYRDNHVFAGYGPVLAAEFVNAGRHVRAVRFAPDGEKASYFDDRGVSMRRFFLASPLKFQPVITSAFTTSRLHPILREVRAHLGVDYRAPEGAPVQAVADGVVVSAGTSGGAGRMVHLRHANGFETQYLHLSSIAVRAGSHVRQGELIGRVGSSGLATGPHLDYRLKQHGVYINPVTAHRAMPPADPVPAAQMAAFTAARDSAFAKLSADVAHAANAGPVAQ
jgi:murein DD-endopeptidase MepM/ murein hydrolase activator NlpD